MRGHAAHEGKDTLTESPWTGVSASEVGKHALSARSEVQKQAAESPNRQRSALGHILRELNR